MEAFVAMVRKQLASVIEARAQEVEAAKAEEQAAAAEEAARAAEAERIAPRRRRHREEERRQFAAAQAAAEAARAEAEAKKKAEQGRLAREREEAAREAQRRAVPLPTPVRASARCSTSVAAQETVPQGEEGRRGQGQGRAPPSAVTVVAATATAAVAVVTIVTLPTTTPSATPPRAVRTAIAPTLATTSLPAWTFPTPINGARARSARGGHNNEEDHYSRMAREAEEYSREKVLEEARAAVEEASRESTGRRKKRKEKREREAAKAQEERKIEEALAQGVNPRGLDAIKGLPGRYRPGLAEALDVPANDIIKRLFLLGHAAHHDAVHVRRPRRARCRRPGPSDRASSPRGGEHLLVLRPVRRP